MMTHSCHMTYAPRILFGCACQLVSALLMALTCALMSCKITDLVVVLRKHGPGRQHSCTSCMTNHQLKGLFLALACQLRLHVQFHAFFEGTAVSVCRNPYQRVQHDGRRRVVFHQLYAVSSCSSSKWCIWLAPMCAIDAVLPLLQITCLMIAVQLA